MCMRWAAQALSSNTARRKIFISLRSTFVVDDLNVPAEQRAVACRLRVVEAGAGHQREHRMLCVLAQSVVRMQAEEPRAMSGRRRPTEIQQMQAAAGFQHASDFTQRPLLLDALQVVKHERREHAIEAC